MPRQALLILDIDETLIHSRDKPLPRDCDFRVGNYHVYWRPHVREFLSAVSQSYELACWSSATKGYLQQIVNELIFGQGHSLSFVWDRSRCIRRFDSELNEIFFLKDLKKVRNVGYDLDRVLILEDDARKVSRNFGNAIYVEPYLGAVFDQELPKLAAYLESISASDNFRTMEKRFWHMPLPSE
jgi:RNA polymerase II subunit A small phosphatase-like protein